MTDDTPRRPPRKRTRKAPASEPLDMRPEPVEGPWPRAGRGRFDKRRAGLVDKLSAHSQGVG